MMIYISTQFLKAALYKTGRLLSLSLRKQNRLSVGRMAKGLNVFANRQLIF
jgi:hypothetical protein